MKVLYDYQGFIQHHGGVSRYHVELIKNLRALGIECEVPYLFSENIYIDEAGIRHVNPLPNLKSSLKNKAFKWFDQKLCLQAINDGGYDIFHPTFLNPYYIGHTKGKPVITTMHDLNNEKFPYFSDSKVVAAKRKKVLENANHIIAISQQTKNDLIKFYNVEEKQISVVYHGIDQDIYTTNNARLFDKPYILYVGGRNLYKNFQTFLRGFALIHDDIDLVCTGNAFNSEEIKLIKELHIEHKIHQMFASNEQLNQLIAQAVAFVYPSIAEGFGMPILEAFRCGCPCIISDILCFHEVAGDVAQYFDPKVAENIADVISKTINDSQLLISLRENGYKRMTEFSWERTAKETLNVYNKFV